LVEIDLGQRDLCEVRRVRERELRRRRAGASPATFLVDDPFDVVGAEGPMLRRVE
jgi:hypothetical protein